eukprot:12397823-Karenia_brevis.AAC.1
MSHGISQEKSFPKNGPHILCHGLANHYDLPVKARHSMLGAVVPERTDGYSSNTSAALAAL